MILRECNQSFSPADEREMDQNTSALLPQEQQMISSRVSFETWFGEDITTYQPMLYRIALRRTGDAFTAENIVQETYLKALRFASTFTPGTNVKAWLTRIVVTSCLNDARRPVHDELPLSLLDEDGAAEFYLPTVLDAETLLLSNMLDEELLQALLTLPPSHRTAFLLAAYYDRSYREIAEQEQVPIGTIMSRISRAKKILRRSLESYAYKIGWIA